MNKSVKLHLENISVESFNAWKRESAFSSYAGCVIKGGMVEIGVDGYGEYSVRKKNTKSGGDVISVFSSAEDAINYYTKLITE